jgi:hypothetical protein
LKFDSNRYIWWLLIWELGVSLGALIIGHDIFGIEVTALGYSILCYVLCLSMFSGFCFFFLRYLVLKQRLSHGYSKIAGDRFEAILSLNDFNENINYYRETIANRANPWKVIRDEFGLTKFNVIFLLAVILIFALFFLYLALFYQK